MSEGTQGFYDSYYGKIAVGTRQENMGQPSVDASVDVAYEEMIAALEKLGLVEKYKVDKDKAYRLTARYEELRKTNPKALPFPLNQQYAQMLPTHRRTFHGLTIWWYTSPIERQEVEIIHSAKYPEAEVEKTPFYRRETEITTPGSRFPVKKIAVYSNGMVRHDQEHIDHPVNKRNWSSEQDVLNSLVRSFKTAAVTKPSRNPIKRFLGR
ncbi:MAG: hypothetical protein M1268_00985 [Patescibacteria group bacterium]|nr:hypothetical protein [Patescibacteria group bacterium]